MFSIPFIFSLSFHTFPVFPLDPIPQLPIWFLVDLAFFFLASICIYSLHMSAFLPNPSCFLSFVFQCVVYISCCTWTLFLCICANLDIFPWSVFWVLVVVFYLCFRDQKNLLTFYFSFQLVSNNNNSLSYLKPTCHIFSACILNLFSIFKIILAFFFFKA